MQVAAIMAKSDNPFLEQLLEFMQDNAKRQDKRMDDLETKIDGNTAKLEANTATTNQVLDQAKATNGRVTRLEKRTNRLERRGFKRLNFSEPLLYLIIMLALVVAYIIAQSLGYKVPGFGA